jgi:Zn-dependent metalloprotease
MTDASGNVIGLNGVYIPTDGLSVSYKLDEGSASTAITEYVNSLKDFAVVDGINITEVKKTIVNSDDKAYVAYCANVSGYNSASEYIAYDVFVDASTGDGICTFVTSSFETETSVTENEIEDSYIYKMATASDKFNWNDDTLEISKDPINIKDIEAGNSSAYVASVKNAVDSAYNYFSDAFGYKGLTGNGEGFTVYINPNEYVEEVLPTEKAMYTNQKLMFFREDLTQGDLDYNTAVHEYAHGVMHNIVGFCGTMNFSENAAIAEGLADVFAELAEATINGTCDWVHGERVLYEPQNGYFDHLPANVSVLNVSDCYYYSTIVSHLASRIAQAIPYVSLQNELWFKTMCFMTRNTDFNDLNTIINAVATNMHSEYKLTDNQYDEIAECLKLLDNTVSEAIID